MQQLKSVRLLSMLNIKISSVVRNFEAVKVNLKTY